MFPWKYQIWRKSILFNNLNLFKKFPLSFVLSIVLVISALSCLDLAEITELRLDETSPTIAFPLARVEILSDDFIAELQKTADVRINQEDIYTAFFHSDPFIQDKQDLFPKTNFGLPIPILDSVVSLPVPIIEESILNKAILKGDQLIFALNSNEQEEVIVRVKIAELSKNGEPFTAAFTIPFDGAIPSTLTTEPIELEGFEVDFSKQFLTLQYDARTEDGRRIVLPLSFAQITAFDFSYIEGTIGTSEVPLGLESIDIDIQDTLVAGEYIFLDPKIHFKIDNSFGIPIGIRVKEVFVVADNQQKSTLESDIFNNIILLQYPGFDQMGFSISDQITFDQNNSNIREVTQTNITAIEYDLDVIINPDDLKDVLFFVLDSSKATVTAEVEMSFNAKVENVTVEKSVDIDLESLDTLSYLRLKMVVENGIPLSFEPAITLIDTLSDLNFALEATPSAFINSAEVNLDGMVQNSSLNVVYYELTKDQLLGAIDMKKLNLRLKMQSPNQGSLPAIIKPGLIMKVRVGAEAKLQ